MKKAIIKYLLRFSYPQKEFASAIIQFINIGDKATLVDAPCGDGITSWHFSRLKNLTVYGYDLSPVAIGNAKNNFRHANLFFETADIKEAINKHSPVKYFCIINSFFLLPDTDSILASIKRTLDSNGLLFLIVPGISGRNFKWFEKHKPGVNNIKIAEADFQPYFAARGWNVKHTIPIIYTHSYGRKDTALFSVFSSFYLRMLNYVWSFFKTGAPNYFLIVLQKGI